MRQSTGSSKAHFLLLPIFLIVLGCATTIRNPVENLRYADGGPQQEALEEAIAQNDPATVKNILKGKSFLRKHFAFGDFDYERQISAYDLLQFAIRGHAGNGRYRAQEGICRTEVVQAILDAELPPRPIDLAHAAEIPCADVMEVIIAKLSESDVVAGTDLALNAIRKQLERGDVTPKSDSTRWTQVLKLLTMSSNADSKARVTELADLLDRSVYKPVRDSHDIKQQLESKYKRSFCPHPSLFDVLYSPFGGSVQSDCLYVMHGPLKVLQVVDGVT